MKKFFMVLISALALVAFANTFVACGDEGNNGSSDTDTDTDTDADADMASIAGIAAKGPIIEGSPVLVQQLSADGTEIVGSLATGNTLSALGDFALSVPVGTDRLTVSGPYYNEHAGKLSTSTIDLQAIAHIDGTTNVFVSTFTHMTVPRIAYLMSAIGGGLTDVEAISQAGNELYQELGIHHPNDTAGEADGGTDDGGTFDIGLGTDMNPVADNADGAYALAVSCIMLKAAYLISVDENEQDSKLQYLLNNIATDLKDDGIVNGTYEDIPYKTIIRNGEAALNPVSDCTGNLHDYLESELGADAPVLPDIDQSVDNDGDGIVNAADDDIDGDGFLNEDDYAPYDPHVAGLSEAEGLYIDGAIMWQITPSPSPSYDLTGGLGYCALSYAELSDWRLPAIDELISLVVGCPEFIESGSSCSAEDGLCYWPSQMTGSCDGAYLSVTESGVAGENWFFNFSVATQVSLDNSLPYYNVRCVRDVIEP